ncbi:hypothetical protein CK203_096223 [Vitis vinifera]|uniref:Reverse transcriptase Ty1/copia-type domain-containing protein n=1 Tax=Vitis vinifera TaxID=29760 RepID=A0A438EEY4_VITVI|nr:hypothetical protein CK203_096223 [Vitis vinifera]
MLVTNGYSINDVDKCIYSKYEDNICVVICLYVDDMLIFGTSLEVLCETKKFLGSKFDMKDLGEAEIIWNLMYLMNCTRPDIAYAVDEMKSTSGYVFILGRSVVSWKYPFYELDQPRLCLCIVIVKLQLLRLRSTWPICTTPFCATHSEVEKTNVDKSPLSYIKKHWF